MILTSKARYGVMAMVDLALQAVSKPINLMDISQRQQIAIKYLEQIFHKLKQNNLVKATKGPGGGYSLTMKANQISVLSIIMAVEEQIEMTRCKMAQEGCLSNKSKCLTHDLWEGLDQQIYLYFQSVTLQDICERKIFLKNDKKINNEIMVSQ